MSLCAKVGCSELRVVGRFLCSKCLDSYDRDYHLYHIVEGHPVAIRLADQEEAEWLRDAAHRELDAREQYKLTKIKPEYWPDWECHDANRRDFLRRLIAGVNEMEAGGWEMITINLARKLQWEDWGDPYTQSEIYRGRLRNKKRVFYKPYFYTRRTEQLDFEISLWGKDQDFSFLK